MAEKVIDPVCGMKIDREEAAATSEYKNKTYYFCVEGCKQQFDKSPDKYSEEKKVFYKNFPNQVMENVKPATEKFVDC